jgi:hypothetical protein
LEGDGCHPREWAGHTVSVGPLEGDHEVIGTKLDIFVHETSVHAKDVNRDSIMDKLMVFYVDGVVDDCTDVGRKLSGGHAKLIRYEVPDGRPSISGDQHLQFTQHCSGFIEHWNVKERVERWNL